MASSATPPAARAAPPEVLEKPPSRESFRQAMSWLHNWAGLVLGWLMFAIFLTGTLTFFRAEFNLWMRPELHGMPATGPAAADLALAALHRTAPNVTQWIMRLPDAREPTVHVLWRDARQSRFQTLRVHPETGDVVNTRDTMGGDFFYRFHYELRTAQQGRWATQGQWIVGAATLLMLIALVTGIVTHRRIFKDFFTFRSGKGRQRAWLDAHNITGVLVLPFYLMITFSGLMMMHSLYMPSGIAAAYRTDSGVDSSTYFAELQGETKESRAPRGAAPSAEPLPAVALRPLLDAAILQWGGGRAGVLRGKRDAQGQFVVEVTRHEADRLQYRPARVLFDGTTGQRLRELDPHSLAITTYGVLQGLHMARFAGPGLRWALFGFGLLGSLMIATGMVLWTVKRSARAGARQVSNRESVVPPNGGKNGLADAARETSTRASFDGSFGERLVAALNMATLAGLPLACGVYLLANRLLPLSASGRADAELICFFGAWGIALLGSLVSKLVHNHRWAWCATLSLAGSVWLALPVVNALTTDTHLGITLPAGEWIWAIMDISFFATGVLLCWLGWRLRPEAVARRQPSAPELQRTKHVAVATFPLSSPTTRALNPPPEPHSGLLAPLNANPGA